MKFLLTFLILSLTANLFLAWNLFNFKKINSTTAEQEQSQYPYLSKRIFAEQQNDILINFIPLRTAMREYVGKQKDQIGVYFEYLPSGTSIGVNDTLQVNLASLLKVPVVMAVYKQIENGKIKKSDTLTIKKEYLDNRFGDGWKKGANSKMTVEEAIKLALVESDNTASNVLLYSLPTGAIDDVFDSLDIPKDVQGKFHIISPKSYSSMLRSLYLSSYLSKSSSNEVIEILTTTKFADKIPAGLPSGVKIAHKIGVFDLADAPKTYSDCGIIYVPQRPYILCIMTSSSEDKARQYMKLLSKMVYGYIAMVKGGQ